MQKKKSEIEIGMCESDNAKAHLVRILKLRKLFDFFDTWMSFGSFGSENE